MSPSASSPTSRRQPPVMDATAESWLSFRIAGQHYAAPLAQVSEVLRDSELTPVPGAASDLLGIRHLRGQIVPVMDGRRRLELPAQPAAEPAEVRVVMLALGSQLIGLRVDAIGDLLSPAIDELAPPPAGRAPRQHDAVKGVVPWQNGFVALLDVMKLCRMPGEAG